MRILAGGVALALAGCAAAPPEAPVAPLVPLRNAGFEAPARPGERCPIEWSCSMTVVLNELARSLGQPDFYPFVMSRPVVAKLQFVQMIVADARTRTEL